MNTQERELVRFLRLLDGLGCREHVMLIGSWAELLYERSGLLEGFEPSIKTMDIDFLVRNMRRPAPEVQVAAEGRSASPSLMAPSYGARASPLPRARD